MTLTLITLSTNSFAGLFCENFKCDLAVNQYSDRVIKTITETKVTTYKKSVPELNLRHIDLTKSLGPVQIEAEAKMNSVEGGAEVFTEPDYVVKSCKSKSINSSYSYPLVIGGINEEDVEKAGEAQVKMEITCVIDIVEKKTSAEMAKSLCQKAAACAADSANTASASTYVALKDGMCGKDSDSIIPLVNVESSPRNNFKESGIDEKNQSPSSRTMSK